MCLSCHVVKLLAKNLVQATEEQRDFFSGSCLIVIVSFRSRQIACILDRILFHYFCETLLPRSVPSCWVSQQERPPVLSLSTVTAILNGSRELLNEKFLHRAGATGTSELSSLPPPSFPCVLSVNLNHTSVHTN